MFGLKRSESLLAGTFRDLQTVLHILAEALVKALACVFGDPKWILT